MKFTVRGRIKDLLIRKMPDGSPQLTEEEAEEYYQNGYTMDSILSFDKEIEDPIKKEKPVKKEKDELEDFTLR